MMKAAALTLVLAIALPAVMATTHTTCFNYFMQKDGCVFSAAADNRRCPAPAKQHNGELKGFKLKSNHGARKAKRAGETKLDRRYTSVKPSFFVGGGDGICGNYDTRTEMGVCLWSGAEQNRPGLETAGWLNGKKTSNCHKRVYIQRKGQPNTAQYVRVLDGCGFKDYAPEPGCYDIAITEKLFYAFNPTLREYSVGSLFGGFEWDFDNLHGRSPQQGPV